MKRHASFNRCYSLLWSDTAAAMVPVPETARSAGKGAGQRGVRRHNGVLAAVALACATTTGVWAQAPPAPTQLPTGGHVVQGAASISQSSTAQAASMVVNQSSARAVVDWSSFNVGANAQVRFNQPNAQSATLNRVNDANPSQIFGRIESNGQVILSNANGVYFSPSSRMDMGALTATTHSIDAQAFMAGSNTFGRNGATGRVVNEGQIHTAVGGYVALLAPEVQNSGVIVARAGTVALASGEQITLNLNSQGGLAGITTTASTLQTLIENRHAIAAPDGLIILSGVALNKLQAGLVKNSGTLEANSLTHKGGKVVLEGDEITLSGTSTIEAKGPAGGGTVLVGGDWQGSGDLRQASQVTMAAGARIDASATEQGDGGKVVLWSDVHHPNGFTQVNGSIRAEGGPQGGEGGDIETSGHQLLVGDLQVSTRAPKGNFGEWLLDPYDITISSAANSNVSASLSNFTATGDNSVVNVTALQNAFLSSNITISTGSSGTQTGNLNLATDLTWANSATLTLSLAGGFTGSGNVHMSGTGTLSISQAGNSTYSGAISGASGKLTKSGAGTLTLTGNNSYGGLTTLSGGNLNLGSANAIGTTGAISFFGGTLQYSAANTTDYVGRFTANQTYRIDTNDQNVTLAAVLSGTSGLIKLGSGTLTLTGGNTYTGLTTISAGTLALSDAGSISTSSSVANSGVFDISATTNGASVKYITGSGATVLGSKTLTFTSVGTGQSYAGVISGTGGLVMPGSGSFALSGNNTYTGSTIIPLGGTLTLGAVGAAGASGSLAGPINVGGVFTINRSGSLTLNSPISGAGTFNFSSGTLTLAGNNAFSGTLNWSSSGSMTLNGSSAWGDAITVPSGKNLFVTGQGSLPNTVVTLVGSTTTLDISGSIGGVTLKGLKSYWSGSRIALGGKTLTLAMPAGTSSLLEMGGAITGTGGISVVNTTGSGMVTFNLGIGSGHAGPTSVDAYSTLALGTSGSISSSSGLNLFGTLTSSVTGVGTTLKNLSGNGTVSISTGSLNINNASGEFSGRLDLSVPLSLTGGRLLLTGDNTLFTGEISIGTATLELGHAGALGPSTATRAITLGGGTLDLRGITPLAPRSITVAFGSSSIINTAAGTATLNSAISHNYLNSVLTVDAAPNASLILGGNITGGSTLTKGSGLGTVVLTGNNATKFGVVNVNGGTLQVGTLNGTTGSLGSSSVTTNANLNFYRSGALTLSSMAGVAISGTGNVTVQATGAVNVDRTITLTGANSIVRLIAGSASAANTSLVSDLTLTNLVTTSSTGTLLLFAGSPTTTVVNGSTANLNLKLAGAIGAIRYKTYNADLSSLSGLVSGTRNFYYRLQPALTVSGATVTASKIYDGTTLALNPIVTGGTLSGAVDADSMTFSPIGATYLTPDVGVNKAMNFSLRALSSSASWNVSGYATTATGTTAAGTITPAPLVIQANDDARFVTLTDAPGYAGVSYSGLVNQETSAVLGGTLAVARISPTVNLAGQYTLTPSGLTSNNYSITYRTGTYTIVPANQLLIRVADASTVYGNSPSYNVVSARYLMPDNSVIDLTSQLTLNAGTYTLNDGASGNAQFGLALNNPTLSTAGLPSVGVWNMAASGAIATSPNFSNTLSVVGTQTITPKTLTVTATVASKIYDGGTSASGVNLSDDRIQGDLLTATYSAAAFASINAGLAVSATVSGIAASGTDMANYQILSSTTSTASAITPKSISISGLSASAKTYDGTNSAVVSSYGSLSGILGADDVQIDSWNAVATYSDKNVGVGKVITINGVGLGGANAANYALASPLNSSADITAKALTVTGTSVAHKTYDGTTSATLSGGALSGVVNADTANVLLNQAGSFVDKNAGNNKAVTAANTITGSEAINYTLTQPSGLLANITPKTLTVKANNDANFFALPDSTTVFNGVSYSGFVIGESSANLVFDNGVGPSVSSSLTAGQRSTPATYTGVLTPSGITAGNYAPVYQTGDFTVVPADKLLIRVPNSTATYGTSASVSTPTASYYSSAYSIEVNSLTVTPNGGSFDIVDSTYNGGLTVQLAPSTLPSQRSASGFANVGTYKLDTTSTSNLIGVRFSDTVEVSGVQTVTPKALIVTGSASNKTYDGLYTAAVSLSATHAVAGDALNYSHTSALFANKNVQSAVPVSVQGIGLGGLDAGNYQLQNTTATLAANITPATLTVSGTTVANKVYDGTTTATLSNGVLVGVIDSDVSNLALGQSGNFFDKNVGNTKTVTASNTITGSEASNYVLTQPTGLSANITPKALTISGITAANKVYDGNTNATVSTVGLTRTGLVTGDDVTVSALGTFADKNVSNGKTVSLNSSYGGADLNNYTITDQASTVADITQKALTISGITAQNKTFDSNTTATLNLANVLRTGLVSGDSVIVSGTGTFADANVGSGKLVSLVLTHAGADVGNYTITDQTSTTADILAAATNRPQAPSTSTIQGLPSPRGPRSEAVNSADSATPSSAAAPNASVYQGSQVSQGVQSGGEGVATLGVGDVNGMSRSSGVEVKLVSAPAAQSQGVITVVLPKGAIDTSTPLVISVADQIGQYVSGISAADISVSLPNNMPLPNWIEYRATDNAFVLSKVPTGALPMLVAMTFKDVRFLVRISESAAVN